MAAVSDREFGIAILDEAQHIKNPDAQVSKSAHALKARHRFALTGTPIENRLSEMWSIFDFVSPGLLGELKSFEDKIARHDDPHREARPDGQRRRDVELASDDLLSGVVDRVLLDKSMGMGLGMDAMAMLPFLREISERIPQLQLVVAGGLGPTSLHLLDPVLAEFPRISFDAQGKLRPSGDALNEPLDWHYVRSYLYQAIAKIYYYQGLAA